MDRIFGIRIRNRESEIGNQKFEIGFLGSRKNLPKNGCKASRIILIFFIFAKFMAYLIIFQSFAALSTLKNHQNVPKTVKNWRKLVFILPQNELKHGKNSNYKCLFRWTETKINAFWKNFLHTGGSSSGTLHLTFFFKNVEFSLLGKQCIVLPKWISFSVFKLIVCLF